MPCTAGGRACGIAMLATVADAHRYVNLSLAYLPLAPTIRRHSARARWTASSSVCIGLTAAGFARFAHLQTGQQEGDERAARGFASLAGLGGGKWTRNLLQAAPRS